MKSFPFVAFFTISIVVFSSCTKKEQVDEKTQAPAAQTQPVAAQNTAPASEAKTTAVELALSTDGDNLYFDKKDFEVKAGQNIKLSFKNSSSAASNMTHNWVLAKPGTEQAVSTEGLQAGDSKDWVAEGPNVLAHTRLAKPGETVIVVFTAPAAGDYPYLCTFPGHSVTMKGTLHVK